ncbi:MAG: hypothetical protein DI586_01650 [Micavibrio aeruginosavorus]|uniref:Abnormal spindle-like microcephaly-associated protein ASH domain-containing protein n=1 Tax=Micavibrio aeruginosavorus TaxID=349221 RepID=A0A2W5FPY7_9BACT|nr:MAG: hypothetical protein DI586_01650 [Micavibrio aeruginosavorus]
MRKKLLLTISALSFLLTPHTAAFATALDDPASRGATGAVAGGGLAPVEDEIDAEEVTIGATSQVVMRFRNESGKEIKISKIDLYPSSTVSAGVSVDECSSGPVPAGSECAIVVTVKGLKTGNWRVEALVRHDAKSKITTASMKGTVAEGDEATDKLLSDVETIPDEIDFGSITSGRPMVKSVILRNVTSDPLEITSVIVSPDTSGYTVKTQCGKLAPGAACMVELTWAPLSKGQADGVLTVEHTGATKVASVLLTGEYDPEDVEKANIFPESVAGKGLLVASSEEIDFGSINSEASVTVSLVNVGDADIELGHIELGGIENGLSVSHTGCKLGMILKPVEACPMTLTWSAIREGSIIDDVQVHHDGARGVLVLPVRGSASAAVNRDTKAVVVETTTPGKETTAAKPVDKSTALEGFVITSHSGKRAIINGPGGSRVVSDNQQIVLGGIQWVVDITPQGIDFTSGRDRIRLLFDRSLSSINRTASQSGGSSTSSGSAAASPTTSPASSSSQ